MAEEAQSFLGAGKRKDGAKNIMNDKKVQVLKREGEQNFIGIIKIQSNGICDQNKTIKGVLFKETNLYVTCLNVTCLIWIHCGKHMDQ